MNTFSENKWETDKVGDKLNKDLFKKGNKKKKNRNSKLNNCKGKNNDDNEKELVKSDVKMSIQRQNETKSGKNPKKRSRKTSNIDINSNNAKKLKLSSEQITKINIKNSTTNNLTSTKNNNRKINSKITNKSKNNVDTMKLKSTKKEKKTKLKNKNKSTNNNGNIEKCEGQLNVKKIQEMLLNKKNESKNIVNKPETLRDRMMAQLRASRFRYLNETLYNNQSFESRKMFKEDPDAFKAYHTGYRQQVMQWPLNPLDIIILHVKKLPKDYIIADFGCGDARLADSVEQKVNSLDLVAVNDKVIACDMAHTSLLANGVHVVVFCLSLMGSNLSDYLLEANRVLKNDGILKIADIESRFENVDEFITSLEHYGFKNTWKDLSHNLFYFMDFKKVTEVNRRNKKLPSILLKSCLYKKR